MFTKYDLESQKKTLFWLYGGKNDQNFIEKEEFLKMLFNYPKKDLEQLFEQMNFNQEPSNSTGYSLVGGSMQYIQSHIYLTGDTKDYTDL